MGRIIVGVVVGLVLSTVHKSCHALYGVVTPPPSISVVNGQLMYGGAGSAAGNVFAQGRSGIFTSSGFLGRNFAVPASVRLAPGAAQAVARAIATNPAMRLAPMIAWAATAYLVYDAVSGLWVKQTASNVGQYCVTGANLGTSFGPYCAGSKLAAYGQWLDAAIAPRVGYQLVGTAYCTDAPATACGGMYGSNPNNGDNFEMTANWYVNPDAGGQTTQPATQADFDTLAQSQPMPDAVASEAVKVMPLPVELPSIEPTTTNIGEPRETPEGNVQDRIRTTPANDASSPWRVDQTVETVPEGTPDGTEGEEKPIDPCDAHPERVGCQTLSLPDTPDPQSTTHTISYEADSLGLPSGCPAPRSFNVHGWSLSWSYDVVCTNAPPIRFALLAMAAVGALIMIVTTVKT